MSVRTATLSILLLTISVPVARLVSLPQLNPLPICVLLPLLAVALFCVKGRHCVSAWTGLLSIVVGVLVGTGLSVALAVLDYGSAIFRTPGFQIGRVYYGWDNVYVPASASVGALAAAIVCHRRQGCEWSRTKRLQATATTEEFGETAASRFGGRS